MNRYFNHYEPVHMLKEKLRLPDVILICELIVTRI